MADDSSSSSSPKGLSLEMLAAEDDTAEETALRGLAPLRKPDENMLVLDSEESFGSCLKRDSKRLSDEGLRPGFGFDAGPSAKASIVRLLLKPVGPLLVPALTVALQNTKEQTLSSVAWSKIQIEVHEHKYTGSKENTQMTLRI